MNPYCTVEEVRQETRNDSEEESAAFEVAVESASRFVDQYCNRSFFHRAFTEQEPFLLKKKDIVNESMLILPFRIKELSGLSVNGVTIDVEKYDFSEYSVWLLDPEPDDRYSRLETWHEQQALFASTTKRVAVRVWGEFGYLPDPLNEEGSPPIDLPAAIRRATVLIAAAFSGLNTHDYVDVSGVRQNVNDNKIPAEAIKLLEPFRYLPSF